jgi:hypothetical protein
MMRFRRPKSSPFWRIYPLLGLMTFAVLLSSCSASVDESLEERVSPEVSQEASSSPSPEFPSFIKFVFCGINEKVDLLNNEIQAVKDGIASRQDVAIPLKELSGSLELASDMIERIYKSEDNKEVVNLFNTSVPEVLSRLNEDRVWFLQKRVRVLDYSEFSSSVIESRAASLEEYVDGYCREN